MKDDSITFVFVRFRRNMAQISQLNCKKKDAKSVDLGEKVLRILSIFECEKHPKYRET